MGDEEGVYEVILKGFLGVEFDPFEPTYYPINAFLCGLVESVVNSTFEGGISARVDLLVVEWWNEADVDHVAYTDPFPEVTGEMEVLDFENVDTCDLCHGDDTGKNGGFGL